ncbi:MAG: polymer-forming cytoskeletal protein [Bacteroidetes bacterium]|nr:MAG: polymer-forming cytoskeletal protein [Bacteroidota bacterium]
MFGNNNKKKENGRGSAIIPSAMSHQLNSLVEGTRVEGTLRAQSDIRVDGTIKGTLLCSAKVIIGPTGVVEGEIQCQNAIIEGKFEGTLKVNELLNIRETAHVTGEVAYGKLIVQSGAVINGSYKVLSPSNGAADPAAAKTLSQAQPSKGDNLAGKTKLQKESAN